jgi:hypothetical protein
MSFLQNFEALRKSIPIPGLRSFSNENCEYSDYGGNNKNCHYCINCIQLTNGKYCDFSGLNSNDITDCIFCGYSELCYECVECMYCYHSAYLFDCTKCRDCNFCSMCIDCTNCFGCVALTHKQHCIYNKQYTKDEYLTKVAKLMSRPAKENMTKLQALIQQTPYPQSHQRNNVNCLYGDYISYSKNVYWGFNTYWLEDSGYVFLGGKAKNCWDLYFVGGSTGKDIMSGISEYCYECVGGSSIYHCFYTYQSSNCTNCYYSWALDNCSDCFGCVALSNKKYCILNNQLTKEEYERGMALIKKELRWK